MHVSGISHLGFVRFQCWEPFRKAKQCRLSELSCALRSAQIEMVHYKATVGIQKRWVHCVLGTSRLPQRLITTPSDFGGPFFPSRVEVQCPVFFRHLDELRQQWQGREQDDLSSSQSPLGLSTLSENQDPMQSRLQRLSHRNGIQYVFASGYGSGLLNLNGWGHVSGQAAQAHLEFCDDNVFT